MAQAQTLRINASHGVPFLVRIVNVGDKYGRDFCLTYSEGERGEEFRDADPLVEFYDARYPHTEYGQFVSRYYRSTLLEGPVSGLNLHGGIPAWRVDADSMANIRSWLLAR